MEVMQNYCLPFPHVVVSVVLPVVLHMQSSKKLCLTHEKVTHKNHSEFPNLERALSQYILKRVVGLRGGAK